MLKVLLDIVILCMNGKRPERPAASLIKLTEKLDELQSVGVNIRTQQVNGQIQRMADKKTPE